MAAVPVLDVAGLGEHVSAPYALSLLNRIV